MVTQLTEDFVFMNNLCQRKLSQKIVSDIIDHAYVTFRQDNLKWLYRSKVIVLNLYATWIHFIATAGSGYHGNKFSPQSEIQVCIMWAILYTMLSHVLTSMHGTPIMTNQSVLLLVVFLSFTSYFLLSYPILVFLFFFSSFWLAVYIQCRSSTSSIGHIPFKKRHDTYNVPFDFIRNCLPLTRYFSLSLCLS